MLKINFDETHNVLSQKMQIDNDLKDTTFDHHITHDQKENHKIPLWAQLLIIICLASLGALSLAPSLFPNIVHLTASIQPSSISRNSILATVTSSFEESECTVQSSNMKYVSSPAKRAKDNLLPPIWFQTGHTQKDLAYVKACAASFVSAYQTFNADNPQTFETCVYMLTDGGKQRFYGSAPNQQPDKHMLPMWRASIQQQNVQQTTQISESLFITAQYISNKLIVWMLVSYQLSISVASSLPIAKNAQTTVLLVAVPINKEGTGWQVSQWQDGNIPFKPSALL